MTLDPHELELRQATYAWIRGKFLDDGNAIEHARARAAQRAAQADRATTLVDRLLATRDIERFRQEFNGDLARRDAPFDLSGPSGHTFVNQLVNAAGNTEQLAVVLGGSLRTPSDPTDAAARITALANLCDEVRQGGGGPLPARVPALLSAFWSLADTEQWPFVWPSERDAFERLGWPLPEDPAEHYVHFAGLVRRLGPAAEVVDTLRWFAESPWIGADPTLEQRVRWAAQLAADGNDDAGFAFTNVNAMLGPLRKAGDSLAPRLSEIFDRSLTKRLPDPAVQRGGQKLARTDTWVMWVPDLQGVAWQGRPGFRLQFSPEGMFIGLHPGYRAKGWMETVRARIEPTLPAGTEFIHHLRLGAPVDQQRGQRDFHVGRYWPYEELNWDRLGDDVFDTAAALTPLLQRILAEATEWESGVDHPPAAEPVDDELRELFSTFVTETGYPKPEDTDHRAARETMADLLTAETLPVLSLAQFRRIMSSHQYGFAGPRASLNQFLASDDEDLVQGVVVDVLTDLLHGSGPPDERIDRCLPRLPGLGIAGATKLLAITEPDRFIPVYPLTGDSGKLTVLGVLGIASGLTGTPGHRNVVANDLLHQRLSTVPELADDPWGQMRFAYWLRDRNNVVQPEPDDLGARLRTATEQCTLAPDSTFLFELHRLLDDKGQIVLYGPPGTGKTYVAQALAEALAPDPERRELVQFHPSTAYEDFMEGFRPMLRKGQVTYELTWGPLIDLAERARTEPGVNHVLVIDEMNRANLPKVFGELLFLLEYRNRPMRLAYRNDQNPFSLPKNLYVIGTMNLADRSVGQIDAALRRRFAFVSFSPNDEHNGGLLARWLNKNDQPTWPADLVDAVNAELEADLGHGDLLIGPSYFMKAGLEPDDVARIWRYSIEPLASDLFHGDPKTVTKYSWNAVARRHRHVLPGQGPAGDGTAGDGPDDHPTTAVPGSTGLTAETGETTETGETGGSGANLPA